MTTPCHVTTTGAVALGAAVRPLLKVTVVGLIVKVEPSKVKVEPPKVAVVGSKLSAVEAWVVGAELDVGVGDDDSAACVKEAVSVGASDAWESGVLTIVVAALPSPKLVVAALPSLSKGSDIFARAIDFLKGGSFGQLPVQKKVRLATL